MTDSGYVCYGYRCKRETEIQAMLDRIEMMMVTKALKDTEDNEETNII